MKIGKAKFYKDVTEKDWELFAQDIDISPKIVKSELEHQRKLIIPALEDILKDYSCEIGNKISEYIQSNL